MFPLGVDGPGGPGHALTLTSIADLTEVGALSSCRVAHGYQRLYDPVGLPLASARFHHWLIRAVFADEAGKTGLSCPEPNLAYVPLPVPRREKVGGMSGTPVHLM